MPFSSLFSSLQTEIHMVGKAHCTSSWRAMGSPVRDTFARIYFIPEGEGEVFQNGRRRRLLPGYLYMIPGFCPFNYKCEKSMVQYYLHLSIRAFWGLDTPDLFEWREQIALEDAGEVEKIFDKMLSCWRAPSPANCLLADGLARQLLSRMLPEASPSTDKLLAERRRFTPVLKFIDEHIGGNLSLKDLARQVHLQPNYFSNYFTKCFGIPPMKYLRQLRIQRAQALLLREDAKFADIAQKTGFCDVFHFSKTFKKTAGMTPSAYLQEYSRLLPAKFSREIGNEQ